MNVWRCTSCEKLSQAKDRPRSHRRRGEKCGPFEAWSAGAPGSVGIPHESNGNRPGPEHGAFINGVIRQSTLRAADQCELRARHEALREGDWSNKWAALGTAFHMVAEEILRTLHRTGEVRIPAEEAQVIMREVACRPDCPHLSTEQLRDLRILTLQFADIPWAKARIMAIEERLWADIPCPDGRTRRLTGRPDLLLADPPGGVIIIDWKSSWAVPTRGPQTEDDEAKDSDGRFLSERGHFQLDVLSVLVMETFPAVQGTVLREYYPRKGEFREAHLVRGDLEHVKHRLGILLQRFDGVMAGTIEPVPSPGGWCSHCPLRYECPIPPVERGEGLIRDGDEHDRVAARFIRVQAERDGLRAALKAAYGWTGYVPAVGVGHPEFPWLDDQPAKDSAYMRVGCPQCGAEPGAMCRAASGKGVLKRIHRERWEQEAPAVAASSPPVVVDDGWLAAMEAAALDNASRRP